MTHTILHDGIRYAKVSNRGLAVLAAMHRRNQTAFWSALLALSFAGLQT